MNFRITISVINAILSFTTVSGNSAVLIAIWKTSSLHSVANILLASLAVSDLAVGFVVQPMAIAVVLVPLSGSRYRKGSGVVTL